MDSEVRTAADHFSMPFATGKRQGIGPAGVMLKVIAAATIVGSFVQVVRGEFTPITVIQFWLSLFVGAAAQGAGSDRRSDAVEVALERGEGRAS